MLFNEMSLKESSLKAIAAMGFEQPTEIQEKSIPLLIADHVDFVGQAQTGTGKTAAFALPLLETIDPKSRDIQALVLAPTRELANQICEEINKLSKFEPVSCYAVYGGTSVSGQLRELRKVRPQIVVGTPGRVIDFIERKALRLETCKTVVLDEADEMLDMGFFDDVKTILSEIENKKIWMFSATMPKPILNLVNEFFCDPVHVKVTKQILTADSVEQQFCVVRPHDMAEALCRYLDFNEKTYAIVFTRTKVGAKELTDTLNGRGFLADALHGDMSQEQRDMTMKRFKEKKVKLLVCTDVAARGIDVNDLTHVINFAMPQDNESYVHRIGRTGRGGSKGVALSIISPSEFSRVRDVERITKAKIQKIELPTVEEIRSVLMKKSLEGFLRSVNEFNFHEDQDFIALQESLAELSKEDLVEGIFTSIFDQLLNRYRNARPLEAKTRNPRESRDSRDSRGDRRDSQGGRSRSGRTQSGYQRFHFSVGSSQGIQPGDLIRFVARGLGVPGAEVGKIEIKDNFSFFEMPQDYTDKVLTLSDRQLRGKQVTIALANARPERKSGGAPSGARRRPSFRHN